MITVKLCFPPVAIYFASEDHFMSLIKFQNPNVSYWSFLKGSVCRILGYLLAEME